ncbi:ATP-binding protein [Geosporobacter ferrireducens]|uniref:ATP-binding protein n=1 Tax=Geosporobacter ferrireducens TaxID=1424294 RepID=UPI00139AEDA2|nr:ATP-binding protein [Geosporobacter ferrireducens]MTI53745.1 hypothetical protein [Geosporobacter ferrireducens]
MEQAIAIGKFTLESLTAGMYISPMVLYREYIQNSVDAIDQAISKGIISHGQSKIIIKIDPDKNEITIEDNGLGIRREKALKKLIDIGNSSKVYTVNRGFRGIGRLAGLSYCDKLTFVTSYKGERQKSIVSFDCVRLKQLLIPGQYEEYDLPRVLSEITDHKKEIESVDSHYFRVVLEGVQDVDGILDEEEVKDYLSQVAPLPFEKDDFKWGRKIENKLNSLGITIPHYNIYIEGEEGEDQLFKVNSDAFLSDKTKKIVDEIKEIEVLDFYDEDNNLQAVIWYSLSNFNGTILDESKKGIRLRKGNILIGDKTTLNGIFKEDRFNGWFQGEVHIFDENIIPNARRDDFERNEAYLNLLEQLKGVGNKLSKTIRDVSVSRNDKDAKLLKAAEELLAKADKYLEDGFNSVKEKDMLVAELTQHYEDASRSSSSKKQKTDVFKKLSLLTEDVKGATNFKVLNISNKLTVAEKKVLEKVFETLTEQCNKREADRLINEIVRKIYNKVAN